MKIVGIIVEYNPFHNGHLYHLKETINMSNKDILIAVTSGNTVMRGDISCINKFDKARIAVENGVDLVVELPSVDTLQSSDHFAKSAVRILGELGCNELYFGSESNDVKHLTQIADIVSSKSYNEQLRSLLKEGFSYSVASNKILNDKFSSSLNSNDILGVSYIKAIRELGYNIVPYTIKRIGTEYNDNVTTSNSIASASYIRTNKQYLGLVPENTLHTLNTNDFMNINSLTVMLRYKIITTPKDSLQDIVHVKEGIENKIKNTIFDSVDDLVRKLESKRYNKSYIRRTLLCILFNITASSNDTFYIRILGYNKVGSVFIKEFSKNSDIKILRKLKDNISTKSDIEINISKLLSYVYANFDYMLEYKEPYILKEHISTK